MTSPTADQPSLVDRLTKYLGVSMISIVITQSILLSCIYVFDLTWVWSNMIAVSIGAIPNYYMNRIWVWNKDGPSDVMREIVPFWSYAFMGLVVSSLFVWWVSGLTAWELAPSVANFFAYVVLWIAKFFFLDQLLFKQDHTDVAVG